MSFRTSCPHIDLRITKIRLLALICSMSVTGIGSMAFCQTTPLPVPSPLPVPAPSVSPNPADQPSPIPSPTPITPPVSPLSSGLNAITGAFLPGDRAPLPAHGFVVTGAIDGRYRDATTGLSHTSYLNDVEIDLGHPIYIDNRYQGSVYAQLIDENVPDIVGQNGLMRDLDIGEAYVSYHLPIQTETGSSAYLQVGQFPIPVGLLPIYDTHDQLIQTLAPYAIGERNDFGAEIFGRFNGIIDYRFAITSGVGADHVEFNTNRVLSFRLGRLFATPYGVVTFGASLLSGRLPVSEVDPVAGFAPVLSPSGRIMPQFGYVAKTRLAGDATWVYHALTARGEAMTGTDKQITVNGYFLMGEYRFNQGASIVASRTYWNYGVQQSTSADDAEGLELTYSSGLVLRIMYEDQRNVPYITGLAPDNGPSTHLRHIFTVQAIVRF